MTTLSFLFRKCATAQFNWSSVNLSAPIQIFSAHLFLDHITWPSEYICLKKFSWLGWGLNPGPSAYKTDDMIQKRCAEKIYNLFHLQFYKKITTTNKSSPQVYKSQSLTVHSLGRKKERNKTHNSCAWRNRFQKL